MDIRVMSRSDYPEADRMMQALHEQHVQGRPDLYAPLEPVAFEALVQAADQIALMAWQFNEAALHFYERQGIDGSAHGPGMAADGCSRPCRGAVIQ